MHASGQSEIIIEILGIHHNILLFNSNSKPLFSLYNGDNKNLRDVWKVLRTIFLCSSDFFWVSSFAFIGRYTNNCFTSSLFLHQFMILPKVTKMGCRLFFSRVSVVEASEYSMIDNRCEPSGMVCSVCAHQLAVYCSL